MAGTRGLGLMSLSHGAWWPESDDRVSGGGGRVGWEESLVN